MPEQIRSNPKRQRRDDTQEIPEAVEPSAEKMREIQEKAAEIIEEADLMEREIEETLIENALIIGALAVEKTEAA